MDEADELQIISDSEVQKSLVYEAQGKKTLSYTGIKFLFQKWTQEKQLTVEIIHDESYCNLEKDDPENKNTWYWRAKFTLKTTKILEDGKTQIIETQGQQESPYIFSSKYDPFGRTKAFSKAERNADRKQIPEFELTHMINQIKPENVQKLQGATSQSNGPSPPSEKQLEFLKNLGYTGRKPDTKQIASNIIEDLKSGAKDSKPVPNSEKNEIDWCECDEPHPKFEKEGDGMHHCYECKKPVKAADASILLKTEVTYS